MSIHPIAESGFSSTADAYERGRPDYPPSAVRWLTERLELREGTVVVDLAAGTGKLSRPLRDSGARVIAVEPVEAMRKDVGPGIEALDGTAEAIPLGDGAADALTVGQAFHWFDGDVALTEIHRVLRRAGRLALIWNVRRMEDPIHLAIEELIAPYCEQVPRHRSGAWRDAFQRTALFGSFEEAAFPNQQLLDAEGLAARIGSTSAIAALPEHKRETILDAARSLARSGPVELHYICEIQVTQRVGN